MERLRLGNLVKGIVIAKNNSPNTVCRSQWIALNIWLNTQPGQRIECLVVL